MFTGIIQTKGRITSKQPKGDSIKFVIAPGKKSFLTKLKVGDSVAINGACMTVERKSGTWFEFTTINESLGKTNLGNLEKDSYVNLESAMTMNSKLDGHIVQGHVDSTGKVRDVKAKEDSHEFFIEFPAKFKENIIYVGSVTVNGVSLTIADIIKEGKKKIVIKIAIIPHTFSVTTFGTLEKGDTVNLEFDMIGKYVKRIVDKKK